jgi:DNA-binding Lrp family transcriptional regulator
MSERLSSPEELADIDRELLNNFQHEFPLSVRPWQDLADKTGIDEDAVIQRLQSLQERGYISRIGPVFKCNSLGVSTLVAMSIPEAELEKIAAIINSYDGVNHNYERQHEYNLWFVIAASTDDELDNLLDSIEEATGYRCLKLPMLENFHIDLGFELQW